MKTQAEQEGLDRIFVEAGLEWGASGCSMCASTNGDMLQPGQRAASTTNRNFKGRQGQGSRTHLMSPAMVAARSWSPAISWMRASFGAGRIEMKVTTLLRAVACALPQANIDTDQVIPARFLLQPRTLGSGYDRFLFHDMRRASDGKLDPAFPLNATRSPQAEIVVAGRNFGCGSSREAAVYALADSGIRCVIAPSHGDIFSSNSVNNGLLPARVADKDAETLLGLVEAGGVEIAVDLENCSIVTGNHQIPSR